MFRLLYSFVAIAFLLSAVPSSLFAEEASPIKTEAPAEVNGVLNCFDYYRFGSVQAVVTPSVVETVTGSSITFSGRLANANEYPIIDGTLYAKVFRNDETTFAAGDGNPVVDQFVVQDNITLLANGTIDIAHEWRVPTNAKDGDYYIAYFFVANDRYDLMGLSFTDNVVGNTASFSVANEEGTDSPVELSKIATTLNGLNHNFTADSITFKAGEKIIVSTTITNSSNETKILPLQWNQYAWDAMSADNRRNTKTEIVTLAPQETKTVSYEVKPQRENVVYLSVISQDKDAKSILNIRYVQDGIEETRINFPGISKFPLAAGEDVTLFSCAHSINSPVVEGNTLTLELLDKNGTQIYSYSYEGAITSEMAGFGESFIPNTSYEYVTLNAKIERDGVVVEEVSVVYDCAATSECDTPQAGDIMAVGSSTSLQQIILIMVGLGSLIVIFIVIVVFFRRKGVSDISKSTTMSIFVLFLLGAGMFLPQGVEAGVCPIDPPSWDCYTVRTIEGPNMGTEDKFCVPVGTPGPQSSGCFVTSYTTDPDLFQFNTSSVPSDYYSCATNCPLPPSPPSCQPDGYQQNYYMAGSECCSGNVATNFSGFTCDMFGDCTTLNEYTCVPAPTATGNITAISCTIAANSNSCNASVTWTITNATSPNLHNNTTGNTHSTNASGNAVATPINYGTHSLFVRDGVVQLATTDVTASCAAGSTWNGTICEPDGGVCTPMPASIDCYEQRVSYDAWNVHPGLFITTFCVPENDSSPYASGCDIRWELDTTIENFVGTYSDLNAANAAEVARGNPPNVMMCPGDYCSAPPSACQPSGSSYQWDGGNWVPTGPTAGWNWDPTDVGINWNQAPPAYWTLTTDLIGLDVTREWMNNYGLLSCGLGFSAIDLQINGSDGPITVNNGDALSIVWNGSNVASCTAFGAGWGSGNAVAISDTASINASVSDTYIINCNGVIDSVVVNVNAGGAPNAPTVTGPVTSNVGDSNVFVINATDPDGDTLYYEIDWNNDGVTDAYTPGVGYVPSGTDRTATQSWGAGGVYTFAVRATDDMSLSSAWTTHTVTVATAPVATIEAQVNGVGGWSSGDQTINPGDTVTIRWSSTDATTCTGTNVNTGGATNSAGVAVSEPAPNSSLSYQIECSGTGGTVTEDIVVSTRQLPNLTQPSVTFTPSTTVDPITGDYDSVEVRFQTGNDGGSDTGTTITYIVEIDYGNDGSYDVSQTGTISSIASGGSVNGSEIFTDVPFGNNTIRVTIDTNDDVSEVNETDNSRTLGATLVPVAPNFTVTVSPNIVREGQTATVTWDTEVLYPLNCSISGPALTTHSFDPSVNGSTGNRTTGLLSSKSEYTLSCTEPITNTTFTESASVDIIPNAEEI